MSSRLVNRKGDPQYRRHFLTDNSTFHACEETAYRFDSVLRLERGEAVRAAAVDVRALMVSESTPQIVQGRQILRSSLCLGSFFGRKKKGHSTIMVRPIIVQK
ncbi:hypothetical protein NQZ68_012434 [Dissostichus eleginoides]|nr:hypothetical protein NQZ68_012434 [Dissostichus eleginoides]